MLNALFGTEARTKILNLLLLDPEKKFNLRQLSKEAGVPLASARKELSNLSTFGLIKEDGQNWSANKDFIIFSELRALIVKAQILSSQKFIEGVKKISNPKFLALTGIFTGDHLVKTDILIVGPIKRRPFLKLVEELEGSLGREIDFTLMDETEFFYRQEVMDIFLYNVMTGKTIILINSLPLDPKLGKINNSFSFSGLSGVTEPSDTEDQKHLSTKEQDDLKNNSYLQKDEEPA